MLRQVRHLVRLAAGLRTQHRELPVLWRQQSGKRFQQRGLARAVGADECEQIAWSEIERDVLDNGVMTVADGKVMRVNVHRTCTDP